MILAVSAEFETFAYEIMSGSRRGPAASLLRTALRVVEPFYCGAMSLRNFAYEHGAKKVARLPRPVISIGNITTGGTGKTPMVRWLAGRLRADGRHVAVLSRGYKSADGKLGDEQLMLDRFLNLPGQTPVLLRANPRRAAEGLATLREHPETDIFLLDDGFQHRAVVRDLDIVLINSADPFGFGHVLPRGLLREPLRGLRRAGAIVLTHADRATAEQLSDIERVVRMHHPDVPIYHASHAFAGLRTAATAWAQPPDRNADDLQAVKFFAFCGIGSPHLFQMQLVATGGQCVGRRWFADHHQYSLDDLQTVREQACAAGAQVLVTTEKDWVKLEGLEGATASEPPIWRVDVAMRFRGEDEEQLYRHVAGDSKALPGR